MAKILRVAERDRLRGIKSFPSLVKYLREELEWPIESDDFEELTFEYEPEELGIDPKNAAKIDKIMQLRPLVSDQPWGIFFVKFEPKRLPVVALRRILRELVMKKRVSANRAGQATWNLHDLLFISNYGEGYERQITFAHFSENSHKGDLPTLKVLGWDEGDAALHLDHVYGELHEKLTWPEDESDQKAWRKQWGGAFTLRHREVIATSKQLALRLAGLAHDIRARVNAALAVETEKGPLRTLMAAFKESLIHDLNEDDFADMYAQTIAYGLLSARISRPAGLVADNLADMVPVTNPFLKELMETFLHLGGRKKAGKKSTGIDFDELGINDVVDLLREANMEAVLRDFGNRNPEEDPVIHFYELFLHEYDKNKKMQRGVFYTPKPVVSFIVRSVDEILRTEFGLEDGLADTTTWAEMSECNTDLEIPDGTSPELPFVQILDPAAGTGTFLVEVIDVIHQTMMAKWQGEGHGEKKIEKLWNDYVPTRLLPRLHGYELMMAPYAIAHMKIGLKLFETTYRFGNKERARVYLTNALEPAEDLPKQADWVTKVQALAHEAEAVNAIKRNRRFTVVIGNPPYAGVSSNMSDCAQGMIKVYKYVDGKPLGERKHWLQDDYVKFIRLAQILIDSSHSGVLGFITNHSYLDNATFRGMRQSLLGSFSNLFAYDLHGSVKKPSKMDADKTDQSVFDIQQGVAIILARAGLPFSASVRHADLLGSRSHKYSMLEASTLDSTCKTQVVPSSPYYFLVPKDTEFDAEYADYWALPEAMPTYVCGITTARDSFVIDVDDANIVQRIDVFLDEELSDAEVQKRLGLRENYVWRVHNARKELNETLDWKEQLTNILYRPFDIRRIIYNKAVVWRTREKVMKLFSGGSNLGLCTNRQVNSTFQHAGVTRCLINDCTLSLATKERTYVFPLWLTPENTEGRLLGDMELRPNFSIGFMHALSTSLLGSHQGNDGLPSDISAEQVVAYFYSILHCPTYRSRYTEQLKIAYPRFPLTSGPELFLKLAQFGSELIALHLMESPRLNGHITTLIDSGDLQVEKVSYSDETVWIDKAKTRGFRGVPEEVWNFHIGGYQVCEKWLKDRQAKGGKNPRSGRVLNDEDIDHYQKIIVALNETIRIMKEIDEVIEQHGGWPDAFVVDKAATDG